MARNVTGERAVVKNADMDEPMQNLAVELAAQALERFVIEKDIASYIKREFDKRYGPTWHCVVGRHFGSYVTHEVRNFVYFYVGTLAFLLFKSGENMLDGFHVTSPWSDSRSLVASWTWNANAHLQLFEKAYLLFYSPLDEGFERTEVITHPITFYVLKNLRPETIYLVCLRVHHRLRANNSLTLPPVSQLATTNLLTTTTTTTTTTTASTHSQGSLNNWPTWQPPSPISPDKYAYEVRCAQATTQNWHLSALVGGLLGVVFALIIGFLLRLVLRRKCWRPGGGRGFGKQVTENSLIGNSGSSHSSYQKSVRRPNTKRQRSLRSRLCAARSSSSRGELSEHLREEDEDEDEDEDAIAEDDDEDTEIDTGCKSSVRSQTGIYGGSGGTTGSSNRHSSVCSSVDAREEASLVVHTARLPLNGGQVGVGARRSRDYKRPDATNYNVREPGAPIPTNERIMTHSILIKQHFPDSLDNGTIVPLVSPQLLGNSSRPPIINLQKPPETNIRQLVDSCDLGNCQSPAPLAEPQPVNLTAPVLRCPLETFAWVESPRIDACLLNCLPETPYVFDEDNEDVAVATDIGVDFEHSLSLSNATSRSSGTRGVYDVGGDGTDGEEYSYEMCDISGNTDSEVKQHPPIYMEFIETI